MSVRGHSRRLQKTGWVLVLAACSAELATEHGPADRGAPPGLGALEIITTRAGSAADPDGYTLVLNGASIAALAVEDTLLLSNVPEGDYWVGISRVAAGCDTGGANPRGLRVAPGQTTRAIFVVKCGTSAPGPTS